MEQLIETLKAFKNNPEVTFEQLTQVFTKVDQLHFFDALNVVRTVQVMLEISKDPEATTVLSGLRKSAVNRVITSVAATDDGSVANSMRDQAWPLLNPVEHKMLLNRARLAAPGYTNALASNTV